MKKLAIVLAFAATPALADSYNKTKVEDHYKDSTVRIPHTQRVCNTVDVPVYGEERFDQGGAIVGGIVGGLLGSQIGKGSGNKVATGAGAITGAIIGGKKDGSVVGYRREEQCHNETTYEYRVDTEYSHSTVTFWYEGKKYVLSFQK
jgi:outer membrane lipoprotein SlyB